MPFFRAPSSPPPSLRASEPPYRLTDLNFYWYTLAMLAGFARFGVAVFVAAVMAACSPTGPSGSSGGAGGSVGERSTLRVQLEDGCSDGLGLWARFFDDTDSLSWPNSSEVYTTSPAGTIDRFLSCTTGNKVCYGAQPISGTSTDYWGVGLNKDKGCDTCCFTCTSTTVSRRLTC